MDTPILAIIKILKKLKMLKYLYNVNVNFLHFYIERRI